MYHPLTEGLYWPESHYPEVKVYRKEKKIIIKIYVKPSLKTAFERADVSRWTYRQSFNREWAIYHFFFSQEKSAHAAEEVRALNTLLSFCSAYTGEEGEEIGEAKQAQLALISPENPEEFGMGAYGLWAKFAKPTTKILSTSSSHHALEEHIGSHMRGLHRILIPEHSNWLRSDTRVRIYRNGNPLPIFSTFGNCACLSATSNSLDYGGGFNLSPHNIDSHYQQLIILTGTMLLWQRIRSFIRSQPEG